MPETPEKDDFFSEMLGKKPAEETEEKEESQGMESVDYEEKLEEIADRPK